MLPLLFSPDGRWLLTGVAAGYRVWDTQSWQPAGDCSGASRLRFQTRNAVAFSPDSQFLITSVTVTDTELGDQLRMWRLPGLEEQPPALRFGPGGRPGSVAFSVDGKHLLTGLGAGELVIHEFATRKTVATLKEPTAWMTSIAVTFSPDGNRLATGTIQGEAKIWDFATQRERVRFAPMGCHLWCLAFSPDGKTLAASGESSLVWLWNAATGNEVWQLDGHGATVPSVAFCPDGKLLATTTFVANEARLWEVSSGKELAPLKGHVSGVTAVAFSPDGKTLATAGFDKKVRLWNLATYQEMLTVSLGGILPALCFAPDGRTLALGNLTADYQRIRILHAPSFDDIATAEAP
jgi:WD40 repeat protein